MTEKILQVLQKMTPPELTAPVEALLAREEAIAKERFNAQREQEELGRARQAAAESLAVAHERLIAAATQERDRELQALDAEIRRTQGPPTKRSDELDGEYQGRVLRHLGAEVARARAMSAAAIDVETMARTDNPDLVRELVEDALAGGDPDVIRRVGRRAELRLDELARSEFHTAAPGGNRALATRMGVEQTLRTWRATEAGKSPQVRRQQVVERHARRLDDHARAAARVADKFGLKDARGALATR